MHLCMQANEKSFFFVLLNMKVYVEPLYQFVLTNTQNKYVFATEMFSPHTMVHVCHHQIVIAAVVLLQKNLIETESNKILIALTL